MSYFRFTATVSALALLTATSAYAADLGEPIYEAPVIADSGFDWTGFYVGVFAGAGAGTQDSTVRPNPVGDPDDTVVVLSDGYDVSGGVVGLSAGYNMDAGGFIVGLEGDIAWSNVSGSAVSVDPPFNDELATEYSWLSTFRGRVGTTVGPAMAFVSGGVAVASVTDGLTLTNAGVVSPQLGETNTLWGWTAGAGVELAVADNMTVKLEYQYVDLSDTTVETGDYWGTLSDPESDFTVSHNLHLVKAGVNWKF